RQHFMNIQALNGAFDLKIPVGHYHVWLVLDNNRRTGFQNRSTNSTSARPEMPLYRVQEDRKEEESEVFDQSVLTNGLFGSMIACNGHRCWGVSTDWISWTPEDQAKFGASRRIVLKLDWEEGRQQTGRVSQVELKKIPEEDMDKMSIEQLTMLAGSGSPVWKLGMKKISWKAVKYHEEVKDFGTWIQDPSVIQVRGHPKNNSLWIQLYRPYGYGFDGPVYNV
ncbi:MAG: hypothetical protein Q9174_003736, partial [Haloplaca sp. 1 TL-2023]